MLCSQSKFFLEATSRYLGLHKDRFQHSKQRVHYGTWDSNILFSVVTKETFGNSWLYWFPGYHRNRLVLRILSGRDHGRTVNSNLLESQDETIRKCGSGLGYKEKLEIRIA